MAYNGARGKNFKPRSNVSESYGVFGEEGENEEKPGFFSFLKQKLPFENPKQEQRQERAPTGQRQFRQPREEAPSANTNRNANRQQAPQRSTPTQGASHPAPRNFFVFDIETIPCIETAKRFFNMGASVSDEEVIAKLKEYHLESTSGQNDFHRQLFHKVVCVSFIAGVIHPMKGGKEKYIIKKISSGGRNGESEEEILREIFSFLNRHPSRLISFNGRGFDMPVLQYRAMKYGIDAKWIYGDGYYNYNHRYSIEKHCDMLEMFSNFGASARVKMQEVCALFNIPCKNNGIEGSKVYETWKEGKFAEIADYCESDVIATYILYLRFMQHSGKLSAEGYNICLDNLLKILTDESAGHAHKLFAEQFREANGGDGHLSLPVKVGNSEEATPEDVTAEDVTAEEGNASEDGNLQEESHEAEGINDIEEEQSLTQEEPLEEGEEQDPDATKGANYDTENK